MTSSFVEGIKISRKDLFKDCESATVVEILKWCNSYCDTVKRDDIMKQNAGS